MARGMKWDKWRAQRKANKALWEESSSGLSGARWATYDHPPPKLPSTEPPWRPPSKKQRPKHKGKGISNSQAETLAALQRQLGVTYTGRGMSEEQAARAIKQAKQQIKKKEN